jgi:hypothetical protein
MFWDLAAETINLDSKLQKKERQYFDMDVDRVGNPG